jgi:hypothetical protein
MPRSLQAGLTVAETAPPLLRAERGDQLAGNR